MPDLGHLRRDDPRSVWVREAYDFTPWLAANLDQLSAVLGLELELVTTESSAGAFSIDILAQDLGRARRVVIENQLTPTDHSHLGQSITYAAHVDAVAVVWVCKEFREEHRLALEWLNRGHSTTEFYGVEVSVLRIDDSRPAPYFTLVASPADRIRAAGVSTSGEVSERSERYREFFQRLLDELREQYNFTRARAAQPQNWHAFSSGFRGITYGASFSRGRVLRAAVYIDRQDADENAAILEELRAQAMRLEAELGVPLVWEDPEDRRFCRVAVHRDAAIDDDDELLEGHRAWLVQSLLSLKRLFEPLLRATAVG